MKLSDYLNQAFNGDAYMEKNFDATDERLESIDVTKNTYYDVGGIETINIIRAKLTKEQYIGYLLGNIIKYSTRLNYKGHMKVDSTKLADYSRWLEEALHERGAP